MKSSLSKEPGREKKFRHKSIGVHSTAKKEYPTFKQLGQRDVCKKNAARIVEEFKRQNFNGDGILTKIHKKKNVPNLAVTGNSIASRKFDDTKMPNQKWESLIALRQLSVGKQRDPLFENDCDHHYFDKVPIQKSINSFGRKLESL